MYKIKNCIAFKIIMCTIIKDDKFLIKNMQNK